MFPNQNGGSNPKWPPVNVLKFSKLSDQFEILINDTYPYQEYIKYKFIELINHFEPKLRSKTQIRVSNPKLPQMSLGKNHQNIGILVFNQNFSPINSPKPPKNYL